jgi:fucose permease
MKTLNVSQAKSALGQILDQALAGQTIVILRHDQMVVLSVLFLALGLVACGFTFIETIANPYATVFGSPGRRGGALQPGAKLQRLRTLRSFFA